MRNILNNEILKIITGVILVCIGMGTIGWFALKSSRDDELDLQEMRSNVICYSGIMQSLGHNDPWDKWYIWRMRNGRNVYWEQSIEPGFNTWKDGQDFYDKWHLKYCGDVWGKDWRNKKPIEYIR